MNPPHNEAADDLNPQFWGPAPMAADAAAARAANEELDERRRRDALTGALARHDVAELAGIPASSMPAMAADWHLVAIDDDGALWFPSWQFTPGTSDPILPDLDRLVTVFPGGSVALSKWMTTPNVEFDNDTPAIAMRRAPARVIFVASILTAAGR